MNKKTFFAYHNSKIKKGGINMAILQKTALVLTIIGALNWGLIGLFEFDLVAFIFGELTMLSKIIYILVGIAGIINIGLLFQDLEDEYFKALSKAEKDLAKSCLPGFVQNMKIVKWM